MIPSTDTNSMTMTRLITDLLLTGSCRADERARASGTGPHEQFLALDKVVSHH
jgi:hypothetical protein